MKRFLRDKRAIILPGIIAITFIVLSSITWLAGALIVNRTFDAFEDENIFDECDPQVRTISQNAVNAYGVSIVVVDVLLLVWWGLSAQRREVAEAPAGYR